MAATHFAAVADGHVVGTRSSTSRSAEGTGRFGVYTHAVLLHTRTTTRAQDGAESVAWSQSVISWHGGAANAQAGLRAAHVGSSYCYSAGNSSYVDDPATKHGVRRLTENDPDTVTILVHARAEVVPVVVTPKKPKVGQVVA